MVDIWFSERTSKTTSGVDWRCSEDIYLVKVKLAFTRHSRYHVTSSHRFLWDLIGGREVVSGMGDEI